MRTLTAVVAVVFAVAVGCGSSNNKKPVDAAKSIDAPAGTSCSLGAATGGTAPATITISGTAIAPGLSGDSPVSGATISVHPKSDSLGSGSALGSGTTDGSGNFSFTATTNGSAIDGYILATAGSTYAPTYLWPTTPFAADFTGANVELLSSSNEGLATGSLCGVTGGQIASDTLIGLKVQNGSGSDIAGATVTTQAAAGKYCYDGANGLPSSTATSTSSDGVVLAINVPSGNVTVSGSATGLTFTSHEVCGVAGAFVTTVVVGM